MKRFIQWALLAVPLLFAGLAHARPPRPALLSTSSRLPMAMSSQAPLP